MLGSHIDDVLMTTLQLGGGETTMEARRASSEIRLVKDKVLEYSTIAMMGDLTSIVSYISQQRLLNISAEELLKRAYLLWHGFTVEYDAFLRDQSVSSTVRLIQQANYLLSFIHDYDALIGSLAATNELGSNNTTITFIVENVEQPTDLAQWLVAIDKLCNSIAALEDPNSPFPVRLISIESGSPVETKVSATEYVAGVVERILNRLMRPFTRHGRIHDGLDMVERMKALGMDTKHAEGKLLEAFNASCDGIIELQATSGTSVRLKKMNDDQVRQDSPLLVTAEIVKSPNTQRSIEPPREE